MFQQQGLLITAYASPLQNGVEGDLIRVRNIDSGTVVVGVVPVGRKRPRRHEMNVLRLRLVAAILGFACLLAGPSAASVRIKDITALQGVRDNQVVGYGLVIGLKGTGDSLRNSPFTEQSLQSMLDTMGINVRDSQLRTHNVAAVVVTADLPAFIGKGARIDITVSSLGDATSLLGGTLVMTSLMGADGQIYVVAQGPVAVSGFSSEGDAESLTEGVPTTGRNAASGLSGSYDFAAQGENFETAGNGTGSLGLAGSSAAAGSGTIDRSEKIDVSIAAVVTEVMPNGNLLISGSQEVRVNFELRQIKVTGIVRPRDISTANTIDYEKIAEARISYGGRGRISEVQQPRWGQQLFDAISPY